MSIATKHPIPIIVFLNQNWFYSKNTSFNLSVDMVMVVVIRLHLSFSSISRFGVAFFVMIFVTYSSLLAPRIDLMTIYCLFMLLTRNFEFLNVCP